MRFLLDVEKGIFLEVKPQRWQSATVTNSIRMRTHLHKESVKNIQKLINKIRYQAELAMNRVERQGNFDSDYKEYIANVDNLYRISAELGTPDDTDNDIHHCNLSHKDICTLIDLVGSYILQFGESINDSAKMQSFIKSIVSLSDMASSFEAAYGTR